MIPVHLKKGDKIGLVAPGFGFKYSDIKFGSQCLKNWGLEVIYPPFYSNDYFFSASDSQRLKNLQNLLDNPNIKAIYCIRGGYGTSRIIDQLDFTLFLRKPKWIIGFSDITTLHIQLHIHQVSSLHAPVLTNLTPKTPKIVLKKMKYLLFKRKTYSLKFNPHYLNTIGQTKGEIIGGNLSVLLSNLGTKSDLNPDNKILFFEDVGEKVYRIDSMLNQLERIGFFKHVKGLLIGSFTKTKDPHIDIYNWIANRFKNFVFPIAFDLPIGHVNYNLPIIHSAPAKLIVSSKKVKLQYNTFLDE